MRNSWAEETDQLRTETPLPDQPCQALEPAAVPNPPLRASDVSCFILKLIG